MHWCDRASAWCSARDLPSTIRLAPLVAAAIACGDVTYSPLERFPHDIALGFVEGTDRPPAKNLWRRVLEGCELRTPTALPIEYAKPPRSLVQLLVHGRPIENFDGGYGR